MTIELTPTYIATVRSDHTIVLPEEMPVGAKVMVIVVPEEKPVSENEAARKARFEATLTALKAAMENPIGDLPTDGELEGLVGRVRKTASD